MRRPVNLPTVGKLDKDSDLSYIKSNQGDYPELVDMEFTEENVYAQTTAAGNKFIVDFGSVKPQDQKVRIYFKQVDFVKLELYNTNDQRLSGFQENVINGDLQSFKQAVKKIVQDKFSPDSLFDNDNNNEPYIDFTLLTGYSDWNLIGNVEYQILQEAISVSCVGQYIPIGSYDFLNDCFYWLTTQRNFKETLPNQISAVTNNNGRTRITLFDHGLVNGESIAINGATGNNLQGVNGIWNIFYVNQNQFDLILSEFGGTWTSGGTVTKNLYGYGCIGVVTYDNNNDTYKFIPLLRSKKLNFITKKEFYQPQIEQNGTLISMYYTDDYNLPRVTYYRGPYVDDGCIQALHPKTGQYQYLTLDVEIANQLIYSGYQLTFDSQLQTGGNLRAGNKRYAIRFISESLTASELSLITNPIPCYSQSFPPASVGDFIWGNDATTFTTKRNFLRVTNISPGLFKFIELICFEYIGTNRDVLSVNAIVVRRESLTPTQTSIVLEHNGNETGAIPYDASTASQVQPKILTARDNVIIQNRLVYGNVKIATDDSDLTDFCKTLRYSLHKKPIIGSGYLQTDGEFYDFSKTENSVGYQAWEWYRFYVVGEYQNGSLTSAFFAFDVRFITQEDYLNPSTTVDFVSPKNANPKWEFSTSNVTDRRDLSKDTFTNYDLSNEYVGSQGELYQLYLRIENFDWNYNINGVPLKSIFRSFKIFRAERKDEVLLSGVFNKGSYPEPLRTFVLNNRTFTFSNIAPFTELVDYAYTTKNLSDGPFNSYNILQVDNDLAKTLQVPYNIITNRSPTANQYGSFYAPDFYYSQDGVNNPTNPSFRNGDLLISYGQAYQVLNKVITTQKKSEQNVARGWNYLSFFNGMSNCRNAGIYNIVEQQICIWGNKVKFKNGTTYNKDAYYKQGYIFNSIVPGANKYTRTAPVRRGQEITSPVLQLDRPVGNDGALNLVWDPLNLNLFYEDYGLYNGVYFRRLNDKYGSSINSNNNLTYTNTEILYTNSIVSADVLGGDVFTQLNYMLKNVALNRNDLDSNWREGSTALEFVSQNKINSNLRVSKSGYQVYPQTYGAYDYQSWLDTYNFDTYEQNSGYQIKNEVQARAIYDNQNTKENENILPTRKYYSELKPNGSKVDFYRIFLPFNFADNPQNFGPISRVLNVNNELFTVQERGYTREYFNSRGELLAQTAGEILVGDGSVLKRIGTNLTMFGTDHSGAVVKGKSQSGKDVIMFISPDFSQVMRFGDDGLVSISLRESMRTFFNNNLRWAKQAFTPADGYGICGVWDNNNKQFIFTIKAWQNLQTWSSNLGYDKGATVIYGNTNQGVPNIYIANVGISSGSNPPDINNNWSQVSYSDSNYYNVYTFTFNEIKNAFTQFYSYLPNHYTQYQGGVITPYPDLSSVNRSKLYLHGVGNPAEYYDIQFDGGKISLICNALRDNNKKFFALWMNASNKPERVDITSLFRDDASGEFIKKSYLLASDFETREGYQISPVKLETDTNGSNDGDTGQIEGVWARFDITFPKGKKTNLYELIVHIRDSFRTFTS